MSFAFSPLGAVYLAMLFVPNLLWARGRRPEVDPGPKENPVLLMLERIGQAATTLAALVVPTTSESPGAARLACLVASLLAMFLYELSWVRYFRSDRTPAGLYRNLGPVPLPLSVLPVVAFLLLSFYQVHPLLLGAVMILAVGHVGIHLQHARRLRRDLIRE